MKAVSNINGNQKTTSYADKFYYRDSPSSSYTQLNRAFFRDISVNPNAPFTQFYQYDNTPPVITVTSSTADTINQQYTLTGTIKDIHSGLASATVNGINLSVVADNFSKNFTLSGNTGMPGVNNFTINATDKAGNSSSVTVSVNYVNQKNNPNNNWANTDRYPTTGNDYMRRVIINGIAYNYRHFGWGQGGNSQIPAYASINSTIPLPKGISSLSGKISGSGWTNTGTSSSYNATLILRDNTTGQNLASVSFSGGKRWAGGDDSDGKHENQGTSEASYTWNIERAQSLHDLVLIITGNASGQSYQYAGAEVGLTDIPTFTWY